MPMVVAVISIVGVGPATNHDIIKLIISKHFKLFGIGLYFGQIEKNGIVDVPIVFFTMQNPFFGIFKNTFGAQLFV